MVYFALGSFILGIFAGRYLPLLSDFRPLVLTAVSTLIVTFFFRQNRLTVVLGTCVLLSFLGFWRYQLAIPRVDSSWIHSLSERAAVTLRGEILSDPELVGTHQRFVVGKLQALASPSLAAAPSTPTPAQPPSPPHKQSPPSKLPPHESPPTSEPPSSKPLKGAILVKTRRFPTYRYGDRLRLTTRLKTPPEFGDFSYREYLAARGIYALARYPQLSKEGVGGNLVVATLTELRHFLEQKITRHLPEPEASLLAGVLLGVKRALPSHFYDSLQRSGTLHVVVVSGQNISFVILALIGLSSLFFTDHRLRLLLILLGIFAYAIMVGGGAAVWRAALMGSAALLAIARGNRPVARKILLLSAALLLTVNPLSLWQVGFQLSFAATAGLVFLQGIIDTRLQGMGEFIREGLSTTLAAQIAVLPILIHNFQKLSLIAPLTNLLIFWLVPLITFLGAALVLAALLLPPLAKMLALLVYVPLRLFVVIVEATSRFPLAELKIPYVPVVVWAGYYLLLAAVAFLLGPKPRRFDVVEGTSRQKF